MGAADSWRGFQGRADLGYGVESQDAPEKTRHHWRRGDWSGNGADLRRLRRAGSYAGGQGPPVWGGRNRDREKSRRAAGQEAEEPETDHIGEDRQDQRQARRDADRL